MSSTPILVLSVASDLCSSAWATSRSSPVHFRQSFSLLFFTSEDSAHHNPPKLRRKLLHFFVQETAVENPLPLLKRPLHVWTTLLVRKGDWSLLNFRSRGEGCSWQTARRSLARAGSSRGPQWVVAHHRDLLLGLTCRFGSQRRCSPHLLGFSVRLLLVPLRSPRDSVPKPILLFSSPSSTCPHSPVPIVRTSAPCNTIASLDFATAEALADKPPADHHLYNFDLVCLRFLQTRLVLFGTPLGQNSDQLSDLAKFTPHVVLLRVKCTSTAFVLLSS